VTETVIAAGTITELPERTLCLLRGDDTIPPPSPPTELVVYVASTIDTISAFPPVFFVIFALLALFGISTLLFLATACQTGYRVQPILCEDAALSRPHGGLD
jgi:hypothetical protein